MDGQNVRSRRRVASANPMRLQPTINPPSPPTETPRLNIPGYMPRFPQSDSDLTHHHFFSLPVIHTHPPAFLHVFVAVRRSPVPVRDHAAPPLLLKRPDAPPGASPSTLDPRRLGLSLLAPIHLTYLNYPLPLLDHAFTVSWSQAGVDPCLCLHCFEKFHRSTAILQVHPALPPGSVSPSAKT
ncbi:hypothetical protein LY78DRAFT_84800 [Colletotrichum sublineola]|nr:hypothetical protein LY78DRAFT_84800 [Colletotrichum sublineola]